MRTYKTTSAEQAKEILTRITSKPEVKIYEMFHIVNFRDVTVLKLGESKVFVRCVNNADEQDECLFNYNLISQIKTNETPEPQYRPFANVEEFKPYRERFIKAKDANPTNITKKVLQYSDEGVTFADKYLYLYSSLLEKFVFEDDSPCGVLVNSTK